MAERDLRPDDVVRLCRVAGESITRATIYKCLSDHGAGIHFTTLTALCRGLSLTPGDLLVMR